MGHVNESPSHCSQFPVIHQFGSTSRKTRFPHADHASQSLVICLLELVQSQSLSNTTLLIFFVRLSTIFHNRALEIRSSLIMCQLVGSIIVYHMSMSSLVRYM